MTDIESERLLNLVGALATSLSDSMTRELAAGLGYGGAAPAALLAIDTWPGSSIDELRAFIGLTHSGTVRLVGRLAEAGLIERGPGPDRRTLSLRLTTGGGRVMRRLRRRRDGLLRDLVAVLEPSEQKVLLSLVDRMLRAGRRTRRGAQRECRLCDHTVCRDGDCPIGASAC